MTTSPEPEPEAAAARPWLRWAPLLVIVAAWVAHQHVRQNGWVLEDASLVRDNRQVARGPAAVGGLLAGDWAPSETPSGTYGPVVLASFALEAPLSRDALGVPQPGGFHLTNLLLHGLCALLLLRVVLHLAPGRPLVAVGAALCFAVHPLHAGTVGPLMGRGELLAALFSMLALLAWRADGGARLAWVPLAALCWLLAMLAKEIALGLPLVLVLLDMALPPVGARPGPGRKLVYAAFLVPLAIFVGTWTGPGAPATGLPAQGLGAQVLVGLEGFGRAVLALIVPIGIAADHSDEARAATGYAAGAAEVAMALLVLLVSVAVCVRAARGRARALDLAWLAALALALPATFVSRTGAPLETRFAYLVTMPLFVGCGLLVEALATRAGRLEAFTLARGAMVTALAVVCLVALTHRQAEAWRDDAAFHARLLERNPQHVSAMVRLARTQRQAAEELRREAAGLRAEDPRREALLGQRRDAVDAALSWSNRAVRHERGRDSAQAWREKGMAELAADRSAEALASLKVARELDPVLLAPPEEVAERFPAASVYAAAEVYHAIGRARQALGQREAAADAFLTASRLDDRRLDYLETAGMTLCRVNRYAEGIPLLEEALRRARLPQVRKRLEEALESATRSARRIADRFLREGRDAENSGRYKEAVIRYERATEVNPGLVEAHIRAGWLRGWWFGNYAAAESRLARAEALLREGARRGAISQDDPRLEQIARYRRELTAQREKEDAEAAEGR
jgi:tetratricopeptide (TPR) repeat protein